MIHSLLSAAVALTNSAFAESGGSDAGAYLQTAFAARPAALGSAALALPSDASPFGGQPASLALLSPYQLALSHATLFAGASAQTLSFAGPAGARTSYSVGVVSLRQPDIEIRSALDVPGGAYTDQRIAAAGGLARRLTESLCAGIAFKAARESSAPGYSRTLLSQDLGVLYSVGSQMLLAAAVRNLSAFGGTSRPDTELAAGASWCPAFFRACAVAQGRVTERGSLHYEAGVEVRPIEWSALRMGVSERAWSAGAGLRFGSYVLDYAVLVGAPATLHRISAGMEFGGFGIRLSPSVAAFSPAGEVKSVTYLVRGKTRTAAVSWDLSIRSQSGRLIRALTGDGEPPENVTWDGRDDHGGMAADGGYDATMSAKLATGESVTSPPAGVRVSSLGGGAGIDLRVQ